MISSELAQILRATTFNLPDIVKSDNFHKLYNRSKESDGILSDNETEAAVQAAKSLDNLIEYADEINASDEELLASFILSVADEE